MFRRHVGRSIQEVLPAAQGTPRNLGASLMIDWLQASMHLKDIKKSDEVADCFARIFGHTDGVSQVELMGGLHKVGRDMLRKARVRFDVVCMLIMRAFFLCTVAS